MSCFICYSAEETKDFTLWNKARTIVTCCKWCERRICTHRKRHEEPDKLIGRFRRPGAFPWDIEKISPQKWAKCVFQKSRRKKSRLMRKIIQRNRR